MDFRLAEKGDIDTICNIVASAIAELKNTAFISGIVYIRRRQTFLLI